MKFRSLFPGAIALLLLSGPLAASAQGGSAAAVGPGNLKEILDTLDQTSVEQVNPELLTRYSVSGFAFAYGELGKRPDPLLLLDLEHPTDRNAILAKMKELGAPLTEAQRSTCYLTAIRAALHGYNEPGTQIYDPGQYRKSLEELGYSVGGVGIFFDETPDPDGSFKIVQMMEGFPAEKLGIKPGDRLVSINGEPLKQMNVQQVANRIRGSVGTAVDLGIRSGREVKHYKIQRVWLNPNPKGAEVKLEPGGVAWVRMKYLGLRSDLDVVNLLEPLKPRRIVLDLRNCQGELEGANAFLSLFLPPGQVAYRTRTRAGLEPTLTTTGRSVYKQPMVVLINEFTGDAASIAAGALRDHGRALLVGRTTDPKEMKAYRWLAEELPDGSTATVTTETFLLPLGQPLVNGGLRPDVFVRARDASAEVTGTADDKAFQKALQIAQEEQ